MDDGSWAEDRDQSAFVRADHVISAFGSTLNDGDIMDGVKLNKWGEPDVDPMTQGTSAPDVFCAGDLAGVAQTTVESANDGKVASWHMHRYLQESLNGDTGIGAEPDLPGFFTPIDEIDVSVDICGVKFPNPLGLASAPPTGTAAVIRRAFENGWGFIVTKTYGLDKDIVTNVSPRIVQSTTGGSWNCGPSQNA